MGPGGRALSLLNLMPEGETGWGEIAAKKL